MAKRAKTSLTQMKRDYWIADIFRTAKRLNGKDFASIHAEANWGKWGFLGMWVVCREAGDNAFGQERKVPFSGRIVPSNWEVQLMNFLKGAKIEKANMDVLGNGKANALLVWTDGARANVEVPMDAWKTKFDRLPDGRPGWAW